MFLDSISITIYLVCIYNKNDSFNNGKLLQVITNKKVGHRVGRNEPRHVKRRPKAFPRLQESREFYKHAA